MPFQVNPDGLHAAAGALALLTNDIDNAPHLDAESVTGKMKGLNFETELAKCDPLSTQAKEVLKARFNEFSAVLALSADNFAGTDLDAARNIARLADLNSGDPHGGR